MLCRFSAEPKSIADIQRYGITIKGVTKGRDSINYGIDVMQRENYLVTSNSTNLIKELKVVLLGYRQDRKTTKQTCRQFQSRNRCSTLSRDGNVRNE